jgi:hypothetical protein
MSDEKKVAILPFMFKKYLSPKGKEIILMVMTKRDKPHHFRGSLKGMKVKKEFLNTRADAEKMEPIIRKTVEKPEILKKEKMAKKVKPEVKMAPAIKGGFLKQIPIIGSILSSLFGGAEEKKFLQKKNINLSPDQVKMLSAFTKKQFMKALSDIEIPKGVFKKVLWDTWKKMKTKTIKESNVSGGLLTTPFQ